MLCQRFEEEVLKEKVCWGEETVHYRQLLIYWRTAKRIIREVNIEPAEWSDRRTLIYAFFKRRQWSLSYAQKVIRVLNLWGKFYGKNLNKYFEPVPKPSGEASVRIHESFFNKRPFGLTSAPITWRELERARSDLDPKAWNWLFLTLWFGLRPSELENLKWKIEEYEGKKLLAVFQHKLVRLPAEQRWKFIPILFPEQEKGVEIIKKKDFRSPSVTTVQKYINPRVSLRGGRKGFVALMWEKGKYPKHIMFRWLGHKSVRTTDNHYKGSPIIVHFSHLKPPGQRKRSKYFRHSDSLGNIRWKSSRFAGKPSCNALAATEGRHPNLIVAVRRSWFR